MHLGLTFRRRCSSLRRRSSNEGRRCLLLLLAQSGYYAMSQWRAVTSHSRIILADVITEQIARDGECDGRERARIGRSTTKKGAAPRGACELLLAICRTRGACSRRQQRHLIQGDGALVGVALARKYDDE